MNSRMIKELFIFFHWIMLFSCVPLDGNKRVQKSQLAQAARLAFDDPSFAEPQAFIQQGEKKLFTLVTLPSDFSGNLKLMGKNIHHFLQKENGTSPGLCLLSRFSQGAEFSLQLFSLIPRKEINLEENTLEHYFLIQSMDELSNLGACSGANLLIQLAQDFPGESRSYLLSATCPSCSTSLTSDVLRVYRSSTGTDVTQIFDTDRIRLRFMFQESHKSPHPACESDGQCQALSERYNCCLEGQCVADQGVREGVNLSSSNFLASQEDIAQNPAHIFHYPQFYYICPSGHPTPLKGPQQEESPKDRLVRLEQLYECTNPEKNEEGLCTMTYEKAGKVMASGQAFRTRVDARDFTGIWSGPELFLDNYATLGTIRKITYGGEVLYNQNHYRCMVKGFECYAGNACTNDASLCPLVKNPGGVCNLNPRGGPSGVNSNDNFLDTQCVVIKSSFAHPPQAPHDRLEITYRVDGSCERINSFLGKCAKHYVQGQFDSSLMEVDDHSPASRFFKVPTYADTTKQFRVFVDGIQVFEGSDWARSGFKITFSPAHPVFDGQRVRIEYFIDLSGGGEILTSQDAAIEEINTLCGCKNGLRCQLTPVKVSENNTENIVDYACVYSDSSPSVDPPLEQIVYLDSKAVPVRYYDVFGKAQDQVDSSTPPQDGRPFHYLENNPLKPNNVDTFVGFHEIYGTLSSAPQSPFPPLKVSVKAKRAYNIFVNTGQFSSCLNCGRDYYSALNRLFPDAFDDPGGGLIPDPFQTSRFRPSRWGMHLRSDDLLFGRACFAPATMIPWTHRPYSDINRQRRSRQLAQHFLFANGYQRDWYGFDYGSVIGSFDGAHWFSVGHERQITATSNKLYLAVNAYFGDLTLGGGYSVRISEVVGQPLGQMIAKSDEESSGAECQRYHQCDHDQDCITQLGWDYVCTDVQGIKTPWPIFDENAMELPDSSTTLSLRSLVGRTPAPSKRCVYRGRGAICHKDYGSQDNGTSYAAQGLTRLNGCSANHWCADIKSDSVFNQKLARFAASPGQQNASSEIPDSLKERHSSFGLGARIIGRPFRYNGTDPLTPGISSHFSANKIQGLCVPGRVPNGGSLSYEQQHGTRPGRLGNADNGDRVGNIGMTQTGNMATPDYYNSCPMLDDNGQLYAFENPTANIQSEEVGRLSTQQNLSTNVFQTFNNEIQRLIRPFNSIIEQPTLQEARCLRGAGSACFTDMDCGPSPFTRSVFQSLDPQEDAGPLGTNPYELKYWQEELVCAQKAEPYSDYYDLTQNVCCRQTGKKLTIGTKDPDHGGGGDD